MSARLEDTDNSAVGGLLEFLDSRLTSTTPVDSQTLRCVATLHSLLPRNHDYQQENLLDKLLRTQLKILKNSILDQESLGCSSDNINHLLKDVGLCMKNGSAHSLNELSNYCLDVQLCGHLDIQMQLTSILVSNVSKASDTCMIRSIGEIVLTLITKVLESASLNYARQAGQVLKRYFRYADDEFEKRMSAALNDSPQDSLVLTIMCSTFEWLISPHAIDLNCWIWAKLEKVRIGSILIPATSSPYSIALV